MENQTHNTHFQMAKRNRKKIFEIAFYAEIQL